MKNIFNRKNFRIPVLLLFLCLAITSCKIFSEGDNMAKMITTDSGLQYEVLEEGNGATPGPTDTVSAHYHGTFEDGRGFDSSVDRGEPIDLPVNGVIAGWQEALQMMKEGDKWRLIVPPDLGYGAAGVGPIPGNTTLIFEVELIKVR